MRKCEWLTRLLTNPKIAPLWQFVKFGLVGAGNTLLSLALYNFFLTCLGWHYEISNAASFLLSVVNAYFWNNRYVFRTADAHTLAQHAAAFGKTLTVYSGTFFLNAGLLTLLVEVFHVSKEIVAPLLATAATVPINFLLNKYWAFRERKSSASAKTVTQSDQPEPPSATPEA